ncbi:MAG TPA: ABC transporter ATP-binding protein [Bacillota bacterium]|nr:ABC transporter ATP-binding protein [Bacillota bacterium]HPE38403.1 ABC transporter ATP-binding protein [Bacillota bacterium]
MQLKVEGIEKSFDKKHVLCGATYTFEEGKIYGLLGRNGAGKTTLFNCINDDLPIDSGNISILSTDADGKDIERPVVSDDIGYVLSTPSVPEFLTGREFLQFFTEINAKHIDNTKTLDDYFDLVSLEPEDRDRLLKDYSHGMKNKMQLLVSFIANPSILLLDEPLTSFDVVVADEMKKLLRHMKDNHILIFSTHIMELALDLCDCIVILNNGVLEEIQRDSLDNEAFKDKIIAALKGEDHD